MMLPGRAAVLALVIGLGAAPAKADDAVRCRSDADCPVLACGPCTAGTLITRERLTGVACYVNPCRPPKAMCRADGLCVVGP